MMNEEKNKIILVTGETVLIDLDDFEYLNQYSWYLFDNHGRNQYALRYSRSKKQSTIRMHRDVLKITDSSIHIDHINGNGLDNRKNNLRIASIRQNAQNQKIRKDNISGYKGVSFIRKSNKWRTCICVNGKNKHLGCFETKEEAAIAYNNAAIKYFGEFARLNNV